MNRIFNLLISVDQFLFSLLTLGKANPDETASSAAWAGELQGHILPKFFRPIIDFIFKPFQEDHCRKSFESEQERDQLPPFYKTASLAPASMQVEVLASSIDFRPNTEFVDDQKQLGSCVAHAGQTAIEIMYERAGQKIDLSRMYLYYHVQRKGGTLGTDGGGYTSTLGAIINEAGVCLEPTWPYNESKLGQVPSDVAIAEARGLFPVGCAEYVACRGLEGIKQALNRGQPVCLTMFVHPDFMLLGKNWKEHSWVTSVNPIGLHAVCVIGYDDAAKRLLCENSYGSTWGDGGFFGIPYDYFGRGVIVDGYSFTKLPVPSVPVPVFQEAGIAEFADGILSIPALTFFPGGLSPVVFAKAVQLRVLEAGRITLNSPDIKENQLHMSNIITGERSLKLKQVKIGSGVYDNVLLTMPLLELISWSKT